MTNKRKNKVCVTTSNYNSFNAPEYRFYASLVGWTRYFLQKILPSVSISHYSKISCRCSVGLRSNECEKRSICFALFSSSTTVTERIQWVLVPCGWDRSHSESYRAHQDSDQSEYTDLHLMWQLVPSHTIKNKCLHNRGIISIHLSPICINTVSLVMLFVHVSDDRYVPPWACSLVAQLPRGPVPGSTPRQAETECMPWEPATSPADFSQGSKKKCKNRNLY